MMKDLKKNYISHDQEHVASVTLFASKELTNDAGFRDLYVDREFTEKVSADVLFELVIKRLLVIELIIVYNGDVYSSYFFPSDMEKLVNDTYLAVGCHSGSSTEMTFSADIVSED